MPEGKVDTDGEKTGIPRSGADIVGGIVLRWLRYGENGGGSAQRGIGGGIHKPAL